MKKNRVCRICGKDKFDRVIDFGECPLVNSLIEEKDLDKKEPVYPLEVIRCKKCSLVQTKQPVDTHEIYTAQDYLYYTGDMPQNSQYMKAFDSLVEEVRKYSEYGDLIVEIGSNDGTILKKFGQGEQGIDRGLLGVDPSTNVVIRALAKGVPTLSAPFNKQNAQNIKKEFGEAKIVGGANCLAHIDNIHEVLDGVRELLTPNGVFWVECNYWGGMVKNNHYALIYHDHYSYFTLKNWIELAEMHELFVFDACITEAQGDGLSLRLFASQIPREKTERMEKLLQEEIDTDLNSKKTCDTYNTEVLGKAQDLKKLVDDLKKEGKTVAGYGAAAKGFSILHLAKIGAESIDYFVDDSPAKQGKYCPVTHIPIISRSEAESRLPDYFFITAPNYATIIIEKEKDFMDKGGKFIMENGEIVG